MKKALITVTTLALLGAAAPRANAGGDRGWATAGKVMAGVGAGLLISRALEPRPVVYEATPVYVNPAPVVVQQPAPVVVQQVQTQPVVVQQPVQYTTVTQPVVVQQPVIVQPAPVVYQPAPVVYSSPVYVRPVCAPPVISFGFSFGHGPRGHFHHRHW